MTRSLQTSTISETATSTGLTESSSHYGVDPKDLGVPGIRRLTGAHDDYKRLKAGLSSLDFRKTDHLVDPARPLYDSLNLPRPDVRLAVVKKNAAVLRKLVHDLQSIKTDLGEIPTLIIDDEADQASINTTRPKEGLAGGQATYRDQPSDRSTPWRAEASTVRRLHRNTLRQCLCRPR